MTVTPCRPLAPDSTDPRTVAATALAVYAGSPHIAPAHWWQAGRVVASLKAAGMLRTARERKAATT